jgi:hypothetical protein
VLVKLERPYGKARKKISLNRIEKNWMPAPKNASDTWTMIDQLDALRFICFHMQQLSMTSFHQNKPFQTSQEVGWCCKQSPIYRSALAFGAFRLIWNFSASTDPCCRMMAIKA